MTVTSDGLVPCLIKPENHYPDLVSSTFTRRPLQSHPCFYSSVDYVDITSRFPLSLTLLVCLSTGPHADKEWSSPAFPIPL